MSKNIIKFTVHRCGYNKRGIFVMSAFREQDTSNKPQGQGNASKKKKSNSKQGKNYRRFNKKDDQQKQGNTADKNKQPQERNNKGKANGDGPQNAKQGKAPQKFSNKNSQPRHRENKASDRMAKHSEVQATDMYETRDTGIRLITRRAPAQKYANFEEFMKANENSDD